jgi:UDP-N-acetylmuramoylalanine--D-glutamate ligase
VIRALIEHGEAAVIGLGRSGRAAVALLEREKAAVYGSDESQGGHDLDRIARASFVVASPGVPPDAAPLAVAMAKGIPIVSEVEIALAFLQHSRYIAITGTNGKTTVTALVDHLLRALGADSVAAGNIGIPLSEIALRETPPAWIALELSSFQLHDTPGIRPAVGVITNLAPDHLDRYASVDEYYGDKMRLFANATPESQWVLNGDDPALLARAAGIAGTRHLFSLRDRSAAAGPRVGADGYHVLADAPLLRDDILLLGDHNVANALTAALAVCIADPSFRGENAWERLREGLRSFRGMPNRLELVADVNGVQWINDSKATNVSSTKVAIDGMARPTIVLLGGRHKGEPYTGLLDGLVAHAKLVIAYGEAAPLIEADLKGHVPLERLGSSFDDVMMRARAAASPGDAVLLSPACSSYDMFTNYEVRGAEFRRLAQTK